MFKPNKFPVLATVYKSYLTYLLSSVSVMKSVELVQKRDWKRNSATKRYRHVKCFLNIDFNQNSKQDPPPHIFHLNASECGLNDPDQKGSD